MEGHPPTATSDAPAGSLGDQVKLVLLGALLGVLGFEGIRGHRPHLVLVSVACLAATLVSLWASRSPRQAA